MNVTRIVPSKGCDVYLIETKEKVILLDTGMFHCGENTVRLVKKALCGRKLDFILLSHTHYDHVGGIPALREAYPGIMVYGSEYAAYVLRREGARRVMKQLACDAVKTYVDEHANLCAYDEEALFVDKMIKEGDEINLGSKILKIYETTGHTKCSLTFFEPESRTLFLSESTGVYVDPSWVDVSILSGYSKTIESIEKCMILDAKRLYIPHYGEMKEIPPSDFFALAMNSAKAFKDIVLSHWEQGCTDEDVMEICRNKIWMTKVKGHEDQPLAAFDANTKAFLNVLRREFFQFNENSHNQHY